jgi:hypothetical protein
MDYIYDQLVHDYGAVTFEAFINLLVTALHACILRQPIHFSLAQVDIMEDQTSLEQLREAFRGIASDKVSPRARVDLF